MSINPRLSQLSPPALSKNTPRMAKNISSPFATQLESNAYRRAYSDKMVRFYALVFFDPTMRAMVDKNYDKTSNPEFRELFPQLSDEELLEAEKNFDAYLEVIWNIYWRVREDPEEYKKFQELLATDKK